MSLVEVPSNSRVKPTDTSYIHMVLPMVMTIDSIHALHTKHCYIIGSGSGQQSVTGFPNADDSNSYWIVEAASGHFCKRG